MDWLKRNLSLVGWGGVALALMIVAVWFLFAERGKETRVTEELDTEVEDLQRLYRADPFPSTDNIQKASQEQQRAQTLLDELGRHFNPAPPFQGDNFAFKRMLDETISQLQRQAQEFSVTLPPDYNFTFWAQRRAVNFTPESLAPMAARLLDIKSICAVLYQARVHSIEGLRRIAVSEHDVVSATSADLTVRSPSTNQLTGYVRVPYEVVFSGFGSDLAVVLDGFGREPNFLVVKNLTVEPAPAPAAPPPGTTGGTYVIPRPVPTRDPDADAPDAPDDSEMRPRVPTPTVGFPGIPRAVGAPASRSGVVTVLNEKLLRFTLLLEVINPPAAR
jgi:hypothetical protein